jgi:hypothetical protein
MVKLSHRLFDATGWRIGLIVGSAALLYYVIWLLCKFAGVLESLVLN